MKKTTLIITLLLASVCFFGQNSRPFRTMVENKDVPNNVRREFSRKYPNSFVKMWYVTSIIYWYEDFGPTFYNGWFRRPRTVVVHDFSQPSHYEVEFFRNNENSRAIFNRHGVWFETRTRVVQLPQNIVDALANSDFSGWRISDYKERIEMPGTENSVFRIHVSSGQFSRIIRINEKGSIVQIRAE